MGVERTRTKLVRAVSPAVPFTASATVSGHHPSAVGAEGAFHQVVACQQKNMLSQTADMHSGHTLCLNGVVEICSYRT